MRRTKIVATIGPASSSREMLGRLMDAGADVFRLNFSHGSHEDKRNWIRDIRELSRERRRAVAILGDLQGPKIRVGQLQGGSMPLSPGTEVVVTIEEVLGGEGIIPTIYRDLPNDVRPGDRILLDDGLLELETVESDGTRVRCRVIVGGLLKDRKGINLPSVPLSTPALTEKDCEDLDFCLTEEVDYVALSFVRKADDVIALRKKIDAAQSQLRIISKIEKPEAVDDFEAILEVSDGVMVARGDLGVEVPAERVPLIQKSIIRACNRAGKPVITATQMLESMVQNPRPTRAETSDVANAIIDGTDAIMLSAETASGAYPVEAVAVMDRVALDVARFPDQVRSGLRFAVDGEGGFSLPEAIGQAACSVAEMVGASAILAFTQTGATATLVAKYRPKIPIYAVTPTTEVRRRLALYAGVRSVRVDIQGDTEAQIDSVEHAVLEAGVLKHGDIVVITMGSPVSDPGTTNLLKVHQMGSGGFLKNDKGRIPR